jgi:hypothetical protein
MLNMRSTIAPISVEGKLATKATEGTKKTTYVFLCVLCLITPANLLELLVFLRIELDPSWRSSGDMHPNARGAHAIAAAIAALARGTWLNE